MDALRRSSDTLETFRCAQAAVLAGDWLLARENCGAILAACPSSSEALHLLAMTAIGEGKLGEGVRLLQRAIALEPRNAGWHRDLGAVYFAASDNRGALRALSRSVRLEPSDVSALTIRARVFNKLELWDEAAADAEAVLRLIPDSITAHRLLAEVHARHHRHDRVLTHRAEMVRLLPDDANAMANCAMAYYYLGETGRAIAMFRRALAGDISSEHHSLFLAALLHHAAATADVLREEHVEWARRHCKLVPELVARRSPARRLRIAYLCAETADSPVFRFLIPLLRHHNRRRFAVHLYCTDASTRGSAKRFCLAPRDLHEISDADPEAVANRIRTDGADILVDVSGHYIGGNLFIPAFRAAPIQVSYPHYPVTTGLPQMDYIFTDRWTCPPGQESQYTERPYLLDSGYLVFDPAPLPRGTAQLPAMRHGIVTFGVFQRPAKLSPRAWDAIAAVLRRVPRSRLLVHFASADLEDPTSDTCRRMTAHLERRGISADRVSFAAIDYFDDHLRLLASADIALDSFPYTGQTTTCDCLSVGVPVVTLAGATHVSRLSAGILLRLGLNEWVAETVEQYVDIAVRLAADPTELARHRRRLRRSIRRSTIADGLAVTQSVERAYELMARGCFG